MINLDTIIGIVLGLPLGILIGYLWRDRISQQRRTRYLAERLERELQARERKAMFDTIEVPRKSFVAGDAPPSQGHPIRPH